MQAELDFIQGQQQELEQLIDPLEAAASSTTPAQHQGDRQRENMHLVAQVTGWGALLSAGEERSFVSVFLSIVFYLGSLPVCSVALS